MIPFNAAIQIAGFFGAPAILSGLLLWWLSRRMNRLDFRNDARWHENVLILRGLLTIGGLASATARAVKDGQANGGVTEALDAYSDYRESLCEYLVEQAVRKGK